MVIDNGRIAIDKSSWIKPSTFNDVITGFGAGKGIKLYYGKMFSS